MIDLYLQTDIVMSKDAFKKCSQTTGHSALQRVQLYLGLYSSSIKFYLFAIVMVSKIALAHFAPVYYRSLLITH